MVGNDRAEAFHRRLGFVRNGVEETVLGGRSEVEMEPRFTA